jgi:hypothetical protein
MPGDLPCRRAFFSNLQEVQPPSDESNCPICLDEWVAPNRELEIVAPGCSHSLCVTSGIVALSCYGTSHYFHKQCLIQWFNNAADSGLNNGADSGSVSCPNCRRALFTQTVQERLYAQGPYEVGTLDHCSHVGALMSLDAEKELWTTMWNTRYRLRPGDLDDIVEGHWRVFRYMLEQSTALRFVRASQNSLQSALS